ncbi:hypothetical protein D0Z00_004452 [Geotrichum galactomycetum]|uniref:Uncharacterized protein n=1 Tax=Geotrichum galactomycetum TaxID=27317 RepID=A0ACB6UYE7_9ASCO|nr:hypothetical protein D0Z00_004452 [Geotrichum candidum]
MATAKTLNQLLDQLDRYHEMVSANQSIFLKASKKTNVIDVPGLDTAALKQIKSSVQGIIDIVTLLKAHITKVGIAFKPPISVEPASKTLADTAGLIPQLVSAFIALSNDQEKANKIGVLPLLQARDLVENLLTSCNGLAVELKALSKSETSGATDKDESNSAGSRLVSIGKVWEACDAVIAIPKLQSSKIFAVKAEGFAQMVDDALEDLEGVVNNTASDVDDFFDDEDDFDDEENEKEDKADDNDDEISPVQEQAKLLHEQLSKVPEFIRGVIVPQVTKNPREVKLHFLLIKALEKLTTSIDDSVVEYFFQETDEEEAKAINDKLIKEIKSLAKLSGLGPEKDAELASLTNDFVKKLTV